MRKTHLSRTALLHCLLLFSASFCAAEDVKKIHPSGYVSDLTGVIAPEARTRLEALCVDVEQKTGAQMAIVTFRSEDVKKIHPSGYVSDLTGVIAPEARTRLEALCVDVEQKTGAQMAIVTVQSLEGESVENYAVDLYKQLGVGSKKDNRGVLLLVAPNDRKYRIEVGYGLEPVINDARAGDAGRAMVPYLRQREYGKAAEVGAWQLAKYIADDAG